MIRRRGEWIRERSDREVHKKTENQNSIGQRMGQNGNYFRPNLNHQFNGGFRPRQGENFASRPWQNNNNNHIGNQSKLEV